MTTLYITGTQIQYYFICKRKLWFFSHYLEMEHTSDLVKLGEILHESSYPRENRKEIMLEGIKIDFMDKTGTIHEVKKTSKMEEAHIWQLKYYLYELKRRGVKDIRGELNYPKLKQTLSVDLEEGDEVRIQQILKDVQRIVSLKKPPQAENMPICSACSYFELCWV